MCTHIMKAVCTFHEWNDLLKEKSLFFLLDTYMTFFLQGGQDYGFVTTDIFCRESRYGCNVFIEQDNITPVFPARDLIGSSYAWRCR